MQKTQETDQPVTPAGRFFLQPQTDQIINCAIAGKNPLDINAIKNELRNCIMLKHPRFCSLMILDSNNLEHWRKTKVNLDQHLIIHHNHISDDESISNEDAVNDYVADLCVSTPLSTDKPLWEIHLLMKHNAAVLRLHHALGDGISLMSMMLSVCRRVDDPLRVPEIGMVEKGKKKGWSVWMYVKMIWFSLIYCLEFVLRGLWLRDKVNVVSGGAGVELWPRKLATARFRIEDMKIVKSAIADTTINDVLFGVISSGLSRYMDIRSPQGLLKGLQLTGLAMVNLRSLAGLQDMTKLMNGNSGVSWGNQFGIILLPVYYHKSDDSDPIQFVKRAKAMIEKKKLSLEANFSYKIGDLIMSLFGAKLASILNYRIICNTTFSISNIIGPREEVTLCGNPVKYIRVTSSSLPHAITMHMVSYAGVADMQIQVAKNIIPDPKVLAKCFEDALLEMKEAAAKSCKKHL